MWICTANRWDNKRLKKLWQKWWLNQKEALLFKRTFFFSSSKNIGQIFAGHLKVLLLMEHCMAVTDFWCSIKYKSYCISIVMTRYKKKSLHLQQSFHEERCYVPCLQHKFIFSFRLAMWIYLLHARTSAQCKIQHQITHNWTLAVNATV